MDKKKPDVVNLIKSNSSGDLGIVLLVLILCIFGIIMVFSASYYVSINESGSPYAYLKRQLLWFAMGLVAMVILSRIDYHFWINFTPIFYVAGLGLLVALFIPGLGVNINGATRWIGVGPITIMPGEIAKITLIFYLSGILSKNPGMLLRSHPQAAQHVHRRYGSVHRRRSDAGGRSQALAAAAFGRTWFCRRRCADLLIGVQTRQIPELP